LGATASLAADDRHRVEAVRTVTERHRWLVRWAARRYAGRGEEYEELEQIGWLGLVEAINRFDCARGTRFLPYARLTVLGEVKRHFRDRRRWVRLPRRLQELQSDIRDARAELAQLTGCEPTTEQLAARLRAPVGDVERAASATFRPLSLDAPTGGDGGDGASFGDLLPIEDEELDRVVDMQAVRGVLAGLPIREKQILLLRFFGNLSQAEIAASLGISQMHVSRLITGTCLRIRERILAT